MISLNLILFIFYQNKLGHEQWTKDWMKVRDTFTAIASICDALKQAVQQRDKDSITMSFVSVIETSNLINDSRYTTIDPRSMITANINDHKRTFTLT